MYNEIIHSSLKNTPVRLLPTHNPYIDTKEPIGKNFCSLHIHDEIEILQADIGSFGVRFTGGDFVLESGDIILIKNRVPHQTFATSEYSSHRGMQFLPDLLDESQLSLSGRYLSRFINSGDMQIFRKGKSITKELHGYIDSIFDEYEKKQLSYELYIKANLQLMLGCLYRNGILNNPDSFFNPHEIGKIMPLLKYIDENYAEPISLKQAGKILNLNQDYFCRLFKKATSMTFTDYLNYVRVCHTEKPLTFSDKSIAEISLDVGFASVSYFNRVFKKYKLITPSEYRRSKYATI